MRKSILILGGASGKGLEIVKQLASQSVNIVFFTYCQSAGSAMKVMTEYKNTQGIRCDFTDDYSVSLFINRLRLVRFDVLINCVTIKEAYSSTSDYPIDDFEKSIAIYFKPIISIYNEILNKFRIQKSGKIITILSDTVQDKLSSNSSSHLAGNMFLLGLSRYWSIVNAPYNIETAVIHFAISNTQISNSLYHNLSVLTKEKSEFDEITNHDSLVNEVVRRIDNMA